MKELVMGIDPGTIITGYSLIQPLNTQFQVIDYGCIRPPPQLKLSDRYLIIFNSVNCLLEKYHPLALAIETQYVHKNVQSAIKLGMARGIVMIAAKQRNIPVYEYGPSKVKLAVSGNGKASKYQIQKMMQALFSLPKTPPEDAADALALALCHCHSIQKKLTLGEEI